MQMMYLTWAVIQQISCCSNDKLVKTREWFFSHGSKMPAESGKNRPAASNWNTRRKAMLMASAWRLGLFMMAKCANKSIIHVFNGWKPSKRLAKSRRIRINTLIDEWCAFSSNQRLCRMAAKCACISFASRCVSGSNLRIFCGNVVIKMRTRACVLNTSKPFSLFSMVSASDLATTSVFIAFFSSSSTFLANASHASFVGNVFKMTTMSATLWPANIVPFLYEPTWRTSSNCCELNERNEKRDKKPLNSIERYSWFAPCTLTQVLKSPGAMTKLSKILCTFVTKFEMDVCSWAVGVKSWLRFNSAYRKTTTIENNYFDFVWNAKYFNDSTLTLVKSLSSADGVASFWNAKSNRAKSNGGLGRNAFLNVVRGPRKWSRRARIFPRTIILHNYLSLYTQKPNAINAILFQSDGRRKSKFNGCVYPYC